MEPIGFKFIPDKNEVGENIELDQGSMKAAKALPENKKMIDEISLEKELTVLGEKEPTKSKTGKMIGVELKEKKNRFRPTIVAVDSGPESLTWQLTEVGPAVEIEKYQVRREDREQRLTSICRSRVGMR